jgi:c-di-GMP-binding flagellar brake protein YcgR
MVEEQGKVPLRDEDSQVGERRRSVRVPVRLTVLYKIVGGKKLHRVLTNDIGAGGVSFMASEPLQPGTQLELEVTFPDYPTTITCKGEVVWTHEMSQQGRRYEDRLVKAGVKFLDISPKAQACIDQYVKLNAPPL